MKKKILFTLAIFAPMLSFAYDWKDGKVYFNLISSTDKTVYVTYDDVTYTKYTGSITIPTTTYGCTVISIGKDAFQGCTGLTSVSIPNTVTSIVGGAFSGCKNLTSITMPSSVITIGALSGSGVFNGCTGLTSITIPNSVTTIGVSAFADCTNLASVTIPNSVKSIGSAAFNKCTKLTSITIPNSVTTISDNTFSGSGLTTITIPNSIKSIGQAAFESCTNLTSITIPSSVITLGNYVFQGCKALTSITIPSSVTTIGHAAFYGCTGLTSIYAYSATPIDLSLSTSVFWGVGGAGRQFCTIHVPIGSKTLYQAASQWKDFPNIIEDIPNDVPNIKLSDFKVLIENGKVFICGLPLNETLSIYNPQGTLIYNKEIKDDNISISLPTHGIYILRVGNESEKFIY